MKSPFGRFLFISLLMHAALIGAFFRFIGMQEQPPEREFAADTLSWDQYLSTLSHKEMAGMALSSIADSLAFDSLWESDSSALIDLLEAATSSESAWSALLGGGWYGSSSRRAVHIKTLLDRYRSVKGADSLFALSELMRRRMLERILEMAKLSPGGLPGDLSQWKQLIDRLGDSFSRPPGRLDDSTAAALRNHILRSLADDPELIKLWKEAMLCSLRKAAHDSLRAMARQAATVSLLQCLGNRGSPDGVFPSLIDKEADGVGISPFNGSTTGTSFLPHSGGNALVGGAESISAGQYEDLFSLIMKAMIQSKGLGPMASLFPFDDLVESLAQEAKNALVSAMGSDSAGLAWAQSINFRAAVSRVLAEAVQSNGAAEKAAAGLFTTLEKALGSDIADWLKWGPSADELKSNPHFFDEWARDYLSLLSSMASTPNMVLPDLEKFAEAARTMRNRYLPEKEFIAMGGSGTAPVDTIDHLIPKWVFLPKLPEHPRPNTGVRRLVKPAMKVHAFGGATRRTTPVTLDGNCSEWRSCVPYALCGSATGFTSLPPALEGSNCIMVQWDNRGLYFAYAIVDKQDNPYHVVLFWATDALEIFLDPQNRKDPVRIDKRSYQFWIWPRAKGERGSNGVSIFSDPYNYTPRPLKEGTIPFASIRSGNRYTCEAFVPASLVEKWHPLPGKIIGFNFSINNGEDIYIRWVTNMGANVSEHPNLWGDLILMGSDATLSTGPDGFLLPGSNFTITIVDHDMNLSAVARDKVWVKVSSTLTGDKFPVHLLETGIDTGVFTSEIGTVFAFRPKLKQRLSTRPGDRIEVYYLDQHRRGGETDVPVTADLMVARGVTALKGE